ncbi:unnamed protein product [Mytilus coruscus]|uniref:Uncharacterized protein n=1 Tax=Mytilus coruscus TaxID=42192 RepID=A0A6J7ZUC4_MYTCO|nr:unnamed protein product [Mytilus coruscus]
MYFDGNKCFPWILIQHLFKPNRVKTTGMYTMSAIGLSISLVFINIITQKAVAQNCSDTNVQSCHSAYTIGKTQAAQDKNKICSAVNIYVECLNKVSPDCDVDGTITEGRKEQSKYGCDFKPVSLARKSKKKKKKKDGDDDGDEYDFSGAGSILLNLAVIGLGLIFYTLV